MTGTRRRDARLSSEHRFTVVADLRGAGGDLLQAVRMLVVADVAGRILHEYEGGEAVLVVLADESARGGRQRLERLAAGLGVGEVGEADARRDTAGTARLVVAMAPGDTAASALSDAGDVRLPSRIVVAAPGLRKAHRHGGPSAIDHLTEADPLVLRLALLRFRHREALELSHARLHRAEQTLDRWRFKVAEWHDMPPVAGVDTALLRGPALEEFDVAELLMTLHHIEVDHDVPSGMKFRLFSHADGILGLDLGHLIGKLRR